MQSKWLCGLGLRSRGLTRAAVSTISVRSFTSTVLRPYLPATSDAPRKGWAGKEAPESVLLRERRAGQSIARSRRESYVGQISPANKKLHAAILLGEVDAAEHLRASIDKSEDDIETIRICMHAEYARLFSLPRAKRLALIAQEQKQLARTVLIRLGSDTAGLVELVQMFLKDEQARFHLCYFAVAEGLGPWIQKFTTANMAPLLGSFDEGKIALMRNSIIRDLVSAHLAHEDNHRADSAINCLFAVKNTSTPGLSYIPACAILSLELMGPHWKGTDGTLWDDFVAWYANYHKGKAQRESAYRISYEFCLAGMAARHPKAPQYDMALKFLRTYTSNVSQADLDLLRDRLIMRDENRKLLFEHVAALADKDGHAEDAAWVRSTIPTLFNGKDVDWRQELKL